MSDMLESIVASSLIFSIIAMGLSSVRIFHSVIKTAHSRKESKLKRQADLFLNVTNIIRILDNPNFIQSKRALRKNKVLNQLKEGNENENNNYNSLALQVDLSTEEAAKNVASTYDRLGFMLKHDEELEEEFIHWQSFVIADMWLLTKDLVTKKWRARNKMYLKEFERLGNKALVHENADKIEKIVS
jgi:hypothetical protein